MIHARTAYPNDSITEASFALIFRPEIKVDDLLNKAIRIRDYDKPTIDAGRLRMVSRDKKQRIRLSDSFYTFTRRAPYRDWHSFLFEARRVWEELSVTLKASGQPVTIVTIALKYINRFVVPAGAHFSDYFGIYIYRPGELPDLWDAFSLAFHADVPETTWALRVAQRSEASSTDVFLDIDLRSPIAPEENVWDVAMSGRALKNKYFEALITEKTRAMLRGSENADLTNGT